MNLDIFIYHKTSVLITAKHVLMNMSYMQEIINYVISLYLL